MNFNSPYSAPILLGVLVAITLIARGLQLSRRHKSRIALRNLSTEWRMTYATRDRLRLAEKIQSRLPVPGAAGLSVCDVIYGAQGGELRSVFTVAFTTGVIRDNKRFRRVGSLIESRNPRDDSTTLTLAAEDLPLIEQYRSLDPRSPQKEDSAPRSAES